MEDIIRVELPLKSPSAILSNYKTIGELKENFPNIKFVKYIYVDPLDKKLKGANPPNELPLVEDAYITVAGSYDDVIEFMKKATNE